MKMDDKIKIALRCMYLEDKSLDLGDDFHCWHSPTKIGFAVGGKGKHSSYGSPICKEAVERGLMERSTGGRYRLTLKGFESARAWCD